jgi:hypothetical protein
MMLYKGVCFGTTSLEEISFRLFPSEEELSMQGELGILSVN